MVFPSTFSHSNDNTMSTHSKIAATKSISPIFFFGFGARPTDHSPEAVQAPNNIFNYIYSICYITLLLLLLYLRQVSETFCSIPTSIWCRACSAGPPSSVTHRNERLLRNGKQMTHVPPAYCDRHLIFLNRTPKRRHRLRDIGRWSFVGRAPLSECRIADNDWSKRNINEKWNQKCLIQFYF